VLLLAVLAAAGAGIPGASLARSIAAKIVCAIELDETCAEAPELVAEYGVETARLVREHAPWVLYEKAMTALPVDYRSCRESECSVGPAEGAVWRTNTGLPVVAFTHVADCRAGEATASQAAGIDCSGPRAGRMYVQYWFYYTDSATAEGRGIAKEAFKALGRPTAHPDDWESYQVRIRPDGSDSRAGSHYGYNYEGGIRNWGSDLGNDDLRDLSEFVGARPEGGWGAETGITWVSGGSHAGHVRDNFVKIADGDYPRSTPDDRILLIPLEPIARGEDGEPPRFAITPPWFKEVWGDPEFETG
jgi:hypothetical protein